MPARGRRAPGVRPAGRATKHGSRWHCPEHAAGTPTLPHPGPPQSPGAKGAAGECGASRVKRLRHTRCPPQPCQAITSPELPTVRTPSHAVNLAHHRMLHPARCDGSAAQWRRCELANTTMICNTPASRLREHECSLWPRATHEGIAVSPFNTTHTMLRRHRARHSSLARAPDMRRAHRLPC